MYIKAVYYSLMYKQFYFSKGLKLNKSLFKKNLFTLCTTSGTTYGTFIVLQSLLFKSVCLPE